MTAVISRKDGNLRPEARDLSTEIAGPVNCYAKPNSALLLGRVFRESKGSIITQSVKL